MTKDVLALMQRHLLWMPVYDGYAAVNIGYAELPKKIRCRIIGSFPLFESNVILSYDTFGEFHHASIWFNCKQSFKDTK